MVSYTKITGAFSVAGKAAIVTGAAQGIGKAVATLFAEKGANVVLVDMNEAGVQAVADELNSRCTGRCIAMRGSIISPDDADRVVAETVKEFGEINILCNVAGITILNTPEEYDLDDWDTIMAVNLKGPFLMSQRVGRQFIKQGKGGKIVTVASDSGIVAQELHVAYCASKAAVISLTKNLALEWGKYGINVNCVSPTVVLTEMGEKVWQGEVGEQMKAAIPVGRFAHPDEIAAAMLFLASEESQMISGENLVIDGAFTIH